MAKKKAKTKKQKPDFEESLLELQQIVQQLEEGNLSLSASLEKYEAGISNLKQCYGLLNDAQKKIEVLVDLDENGNLQTAPFDGTATEFDGDHDETDDDLEDDDAIDGTDRLF